MSQIKAQNEYKVSVITVCYNAEKDIEKTILSVINQEFNSMEYLIIDGISTDNTLNICNKYSNHLKVYSEKDKGIYDAMNKGILLAKGEWIIFMNAGDVFYNKNVLNQVFQEEITPDVGVIFGDTYLDEQNKSDLIPFVFSKKKLAPMGVVHQSIFTRTILAKQYPFELKFKFAADYNMIRTIYNNKWKFIYKETPICIFDTNGFSSLHRLEQFKEEAIICNQEKSFNYFFRRYFILLKLTIKKILRWF